MSPPRSVIVARREVQRVARYRKLKVWARPVERNANPSSARWLVEVDGLEIACLDTGLDAALIQLAREASVRVRALLSANEPPPERHLSLFGATATG